MKYPIKISQSFINDAFLTESDQEKDKVKPQWCPRYLKFKYVDHKQTKPTAAMQLGSYFEWHLLGKVRDNVQPFLPRIGVKDLRPVKSAGKDEMIDYIADKQGEDRHLLSALTKEGLYKLIQKMPEDLSKGSPSQIQLDLDQIILIAKQVLKLKGLDVEKGDKQVKIETDEEIGHLDWVTNDLIEQPKIALYDVKYTETKADDWRNGWGNVDEKDSAKIQAAHYTYLYHEATGEWAPFYFLIFGKGGWIKIMKMTLTPDGLTFHKLAIEQAKDILSKFVKSKWKARPEYNRCLACDFYEICDQKAILPEIQEIYI